MTRRGRSVLAAWVFAAAFAATPAFADKVAVLPFLNTSAATSLDLDSARNATRLAVTALSHSLPTDGEMLTAQMSSKDGVADTGEEYRAAGRASTSDWTIVGHVEGHGPTYRLELDVCQVSSGRIESLAREVSPAQASSQIGEMLGLLLRPEGIASSAIPWERGVPPVPVAPPPPPPAVATPDAPTSPPQAPAPPDVQHRYADEHPLGLGVSTSVLTAFSRPANATGSAASALAGIAGAYALRGVPGLEVRADVDWSFAGPGSVTVDAGARYAIPIAPSLRLFAGPEATLGAFFASGADKTARALLQGAAFVALGLGTRFQLELAGSLAYAAGSPSLSLGGGTLRGLVRF